MENNNADLYVMKTLEEHTQKLITHDNKFDIMNTKISEVEKNQIQVSTLIRSSHELNKSLGESVKEFSNTTKDLSNTMNEVKLTLVGINNSLSNNQSDIQDLKTQIEKINDKPDSFKNKMMELGFKVLELGISGGIIATIVYSGGKLFKLF